MPHNKQPRNLSGISWQFLIACQWVSWALPVIWAEYGWVHTCPRGQVGGILLFLVGLPRLPGATGLTQYFSTRPLILPTGLCMEEQEGDGKVRLDREKRKTIQLAFIKQITAMGNWGSILLGNTGRQVEFGFESSHWEARLSWRRRKMDINMEGGKKDSVVFDWDY